MSHAARLDRSTQRSTGPHEAGTRTVASPSAAGTWASGVAQTQAQALARPGQPASGRLTQRIERSPRQHGQRQRIESLQGMASSGAPPVQRHEDPEERLAATIDTGAGSSVEHGPTPLRPGASTFENNVPLQHLSPFLQPAEIGRLRMTSSHLNSGLANENLAPQQRQTLVNTAFPIIRSNVKKSLNTGYDRPSTRLLERHLQTRLRPSPSSFETDDLGGFQRGLMAEGSDIVDKLKGNGRLREAFSWRNLLRRR